MNTIAIPSISLESILSLDPVVEAEVLTDVAHLGLDLSTVFGPATPAVRLSVVVGRLCAIASDYIPDHYMNPEEVVFQTFMLLGATAAFLRSVRPLLLAATAETTFRDRRAQRLLQEVGVTWTQYKAMAAVALDWVQIEPYQLVTDNNNNDDFMYWIYTGNVQLFHDKHVQMISARSGYHSLLGDLSALLESKTKKSDKPKRTIQAGGSGATLLRIDTQKLSMLMNHDPKLRESIRCLLVKSMTEKFEFIYRDLR
jgi:hypothetical protein